MFHSRKTRMLVQWLGALRTLSVRYATETLNPIYEIILFICYISVMNINLIKPS